MNVLKSIYLKDRLLYAIGGLIGLFLLSYGFPVLIGFAKLAFYIVCLTALLDLILLFRKKDILFVNRILPDKLSNGDQNKILIPIESKASIPLSLRIIDELPEQFQIRNQSLLCKILPGQKERIAYTLKPVKRGEYNFGALNVFASTVLNLIERRIQVDKDQTVPVYPSFIQMRKYELIAISHKLVDHGIKKIRRLGHNQEFEQIKEYVVGDDYRTINWKATARASKLMVNNFQDERSQNVYSIINKGRVMQMPFEGMTLLDYAINASLAISNIALKKDDKPGLITFQHKIAAELPASKRPSQMRHFMETLYREKTAFKESDYSQLYSLVKNKINKRSLLLLYTNFESISSMRRQLNFLRKMARSHVLVCIIFENTELSHIVANQARDLDEIYTKTIAEKIAYEKRQIVKELNTYGIQSFLTKPQDLTINTINKYLELKSRGVI